MSFKYDLFSLNVRGIGDEFKRRSIFHWLHKCHQGIVFLQETHSSIQTEKMWRSEWGSKVLFSHGTSNSRGVAILFPNNIEYTIKKTISDTEGRFLIVEVEIEETVFILCNVYAPTKDHTEEQSNFLTKLREECLQYLDSNIIIGGDFNARTSDTPDFVEDDIFEYVDKDNHSMWDFIFDYFTLKRFSVDKVVNSFGKCLLDLCSVLIFI